MGMTLPEIKALFDAKGGRQYSGEPVTQLAHALQSAQLAEEAGASPALITASLLHDLGHLLNDAGETPTLQGVDDRHQDHGAQALRGTFPDEVLAPIRLHVDAKRFLCAMEGGYWDRLSPDSRRSLRLQGGIFNPAEAARFIAQPYAEQAVELRRWDELAKVAGQEIPDYDHFVRIMRQLT